LAERVRPDLPAGDRRLRAVFGHAERALDAAGLRARRVAGDALHLRVVVRLDDDLVVGADPLEDGVDFADRFGPGGHEGSEEQGEKVSANRMPAGVSGSAGLWWIES